MISVKNRVLAFASLAVLAGACSHVGAATPPVRPTSASPSTALANPALTLPQGEVVIRRAGATELTLRVQIADTEAARDNGLMAVRSMPDAAGMAFVMDGPSTQAFWMKDTLIPLDIAFWDARGRIVSVFTMTPCTGNPCQLYTPTATYVGSVESNAGLLARNGVRVGDEVQLTRS